MLGTGAGQGTYTVPPRPRPYLCKERYQALVAGELEVLGVEVMESRNVTLNQLLLLIVQFIQICGGTIRQSAGRKLGFQ